MRDQLVHLGFGEFEGRHTLKRQSAADRSSEIRVAERADPAHDCGTMFAAGPISAMTSDTAGFKKAAAGLGVCAIPALSVITSRTSNTANDFMGLILTSLSRAVRLVRAPSRLGDIGTTVTIRCEAISASALLRRALWRSRQWPRSEGQPGAL